MGKSILVVLAVGCISCSLDRPELYGEGLEPAEVPFAASEVQGLDGEFFGGLNWIGGGEGAERFFELDPSAGKATLLLLTARSSSEAEALKAPCASPTFGNHVPDCRPFLRFQARMMANSSDGAIAETADGEIRAFSATEWVLRASLPVAARKGGFAVSDKTGGQLSLTFHAMFSQGDLNGTFGGVSQIREKNVGTGTGFTAADYFLHMR